MLSRKIDAAKQLVDHALAGRLTLSPTFLRCLAVTLDGAMTEAKALEGTIVPRRQRLTESHFIDGKVVLLPVAARATALEEQS